MSRALMTHDPDPTWEIQLERLLPVARTRAFVHDTPENGLQLP